MEQKNSNSYLDFGEEETITDSLSSFEEDEFNLDAKDALDGEMVDEEKNIDTMIEYTGSVKNNLLSEDYKQIEEAEKAEENVKNTPENIVSKENTTVQREATSKEAEKIEKSRTVTIEGLKIAYEVIEDSAWTEHCTGLEANTIRTYKNNTVYPKSKFSKAKTEENSLKKYIFMAIACVAVGIFGGVYANSYFINQGGKVESMLSCAFSWVMEFDTMEVHMSPFYFSPFIYGFGVWAGILAIIFLFSCLNSSLMKNSRVGREHGNSKLMDNGGFKKYKNRFMER